ncbi:MAG: hypothetical protein EAZ91_18880 [Cytophagales bacterium]|nr:MAG: hypothetical protein EAZ91_18880 [Cytophagales bacterium]
MPRRCRCFITLKSEWMKYLLLCLLTVTTVLAQPAAKPTRATQSISVDALKADFRTLRAAFEELHPALYRYTPRDSLNLLFDQTYESIRYPLTETQFVNRLYPLISRIRCGHTQLEHSIVYRKDPNRPRPAHFPFGVLAQGNQLFLIQNRSTDPSLRVGSEILSINGVSAEELLHETRQQWSSDGYNQTWVEFFINQYNALLDEVGTFIHGWRGTYTLTVRQPDGTTRTTTVTTPQPAKPADTATVRLQMMPAKPTRSRWEPKPYLNLRLLPDSTTALLTLNALEYGDEAFYKQAFEHLERKHIQNLVLDIRRNHGGDARIISQLMAHLADAPFVLIKQVEGPVANPDRSRFRPYFDKGILDSHRSSFTAGIRQGELYRFAFRPENGRITGYLPLAKANRFRGNLYVLIDGGTFSNGANFAAALKAQRANTVFVGRETGGTQAGCNGGTVQRFTLPNSGIVVQFPWLRLVSASPTPDDGHGLRPDVPVTLTPTALADNRDEDLETALTLIRTGSQKR